MKDFEVKGTENLNENERFELNRLLDNYDEKIKRKTKSEYVLKLTVKKYSKNKEDKKDARAKFSIQGMIKGSTHSFEASAVDWDLNRAVHRLFAKLMTEIEHRYHTSEQRGEGQMRH